MLQSPVECKSMQFEVLLQPLLPVLAGGFLAAGVCGLAAPGVLWPVAKVRLPWDYNLAMPSRPTQGWAGWVSA